jgi:hypothetical protein
VQSVPDAEVPLVIVAVACVVVVILVFTAGAYAAGH